MQKVRIGTGTFLLPTHSEWSSILKGALDEVEGLKIIGSAVVRMFMTGILEKGIQLSEKTVAVLELPAWHRTQRWWPRLLYFPSGYDESKPSNQVYFKVYLHRFHCFSCGLVVEGLAVDRDAYGSSDQTGVLRASNSLQCLCPRCGGDFRFPALVHLFTCDAADA